MRGREDGSAAVFSDGRLEERVPQDHPLRPIRALADDVLAGLLAHKPVKRLLSSDHVSVDGTPIAAWALMKSFRRKDGTGEPPAPDGGPGSRRRLS